MKDATLVEWRQRTGAHTRDGGTAAMSSTDAQPGLRRVIGLPGATLLGLGSILGTGVYVSIAVAAGAAGPAVVLAAAVAALVATCNALSSAQLAANHPVSGGTYEYGYRWLHPALGFTAGWMFLCAKSASAATAALGCAGYLLSILGTRDAGPLIPVAVLVAILAAAVVLSGMRRSAALIAVMVGLTVAALIAFIAAGLPVALRLGGKHWRPFFHPVDAAISPAAGFLRACALMFVAYTGYGRIATLAEEVRRPRQTIPLAILATLAVSMALYILVALVGIGAAGAEAFSRAAAERAAPLEVISRNWAGPVLARILAIGAITAMGGVLLNLILGLSRVVLAMARRGDLPRRLGSVSESTGTPRAAVLLPAAAVLGLVVLGSVQIAWSFSAFTVLIYYALTNLAALRLNKDERLFWPVFAWAGLAASLFLAFWVEPAIWMIGCALIAAGWVWHAAARRLARQRV